MSQAQEFNALLAEAVSPLSHSLAAGLLIRPLPLRHPFEDAVTAHALEENARILCLDLDRTLKECVPAMRDAMMELPNCETDVLEEIVDEMASPALELIDMARRIWESPLAPEAEGARAILATLAEAPVTQLLQWVLEVMHLTIDPWSVADDPDNPRVEFALHVPDTPLREALAYWRKENPGVLPEEVLR